MTALGLTQGKWSFVNKIHLNVTCLLHYLLLVKQSERRNSLKSKTVEFIRISNLEGNMHPEMLG